jgi:hypothetical protein
LKITRNESARAAKLSIDKSDSKSDDSISGMKGSSIVIIVCRTNIPRAADTRGAVSLLQV